MKKLYIFLPILFLIICIYHYRTKNSKNINLIGKNLYIYIAKEVCIDHISIEQIIQYKNNDFNKHYMDEKKSMYKLYLLKNNVLDELRDYMKDNNYIIKQEVFYTLNQAFDFESVLKELQFIKKIKI